MIEKKFMETVYGLCNDGLDDDARAFIIDAVNEFAAADMWTNIDALIGEVDISALRDHPLVLLSFLASTVCFKENLINREAFRKAVGQVISDKYPRLMEGM